MGLTSPPGKWGLGLTSHLSSSAPLSTGAAQVGGQTKTPPAPWVRQACFSAKRGRAAQMSALPGIALAPSAPVLERCIVLPCPHPRSRGCSFFSGPRPQTTRHGREQEPRQEAESFRQSCLGGSKIELGGAEAASSPPAVPRSLAQGHFCHCYTPSSACSPLSITPSLPSPSPLCHGALGKCQPGDAAGSPPGLQL